MTEPKTPWGGSESRPMKVYFAGKITPNDWRTTLAPQVTGAGYGTYGDAWRATKAQPMTDGNIYVGPFFISDDHSCGHGDNQHGAGVGSMGCIGSSAPTGKEVRAKALVGIHACDVFVCVIGTDFASAYGTQNELGYAQGLGKVILVVLHPAVQYDNDFWFALAGGDRQRIRVDDDPVRAFHHFMQEIKGQK